MARRIRFRPAKIVRQFAAIAALSLCATPTLSSAAIPGCESAPPYTPAFEPYRAPEQPQSDVAIILVHGKNGHPGGPIFKTATPEIVAQGYTVIRPIMPWSVRWSGTEWVPIWDGTQCQGLNYLADLVRSERERGMRVILVGHSMGGMHSFIYASRDGHGLEAVVSIAPGHMIPLSRTVVNETAGEVERARALVAQGRGDEPGTYSTYYGGLIPLQTTPNIFLSYHDVNITPDFNDVLPAVQPPWYLLVGTNDPIYGFYERAGIIDKLPDGPPSEYRITVGDDHFTIMDKAPGLVDEWFRAWSSVGEPPTDGNLIQVINLLQQMLLEE